MNLHNIVSGAIGSVNPFVLASVRISTGSDTAPDGTPNPTYAPAFFASVQKQALTGSDLKQLEGLNIQSVQEKIYMNGNTEGIVRVNEKGGDLLTLPNGNVYLTTLVLERWSDWCAIAVTLQLQNPVVSVAPVRITTGGALRSTTDNAIRDVS